MYVLTTEAMRQVKAPSPDGGSFLDVAGVLFRDVPTFLFFLATLLIGAGFGVIFAYQVRGARLFLDCKAQQKPRLQTVERVLGGIAFCLSVGILV